MNILGRKSNKQKEFERTHDYVEEQLALAETLLKAYGNASIGLKVTEQFSPGVIANMLTERTGHDIRVRIAAFKGPVVCGKRQEPDVYCIAEDNGPLGVGQLNLFR